MRRSLSRSATLLAAFVAWPGLAFAQGDDSPGGPEPPAGSSNNPESVEEAEGAEFLLLPVGARSVGMGGAVAALRGTAEAVLWSPAGLAGLTRPRLMFNHSETAFDTQSDVIALILPMKSVGTLGFAFYLVDFGELSNTDEMGNVRGAISFRNQEFLVSFATRVVGSLEAGVNYKLVQLIFRCEGQCPEQRSLTRSTHAMDLGLIYDRPVGLPLTVGGTIRHLGFALRGANDNDPLPTRVRVGVAYHALSSFTTDSTFALALALDVEDRWNSPGDPQIMMGSEFGVVERFFLRAGYSFLQSGTGGPALGLGFTHDWFYLDLSRGFDELSSLSDREALQVNFGVIF